MRTPYVATFVVMAACAAPSGPAQPDLYAGREVDITDSSGGIVRIYVDRDPSRHPIAAPLSTSWAALPGVYESLGISIGYADAARHRTGNARFVARRPIGGKPLSTYLRCGDGPTGLHADTRLVTIGIHSELKAMATDTTVVFTQIEAAATPRDGTSGAAVVCATTGVLENAISQLLQQQVESRKP